MPDIRISIPDIGGDLSKRIYGLEQAVRSSSSMDELSKDISEIKKIFSKQDSNLERRLSRIEDLLKGIPDSIKSQGRALSDKISGIEVNSEIPKIRKIIGDSTSEILKIISMQKIPMEHKDDSSMKRTMREMENHMEEMERKLNRLSLPSNIFVYPQKSHNIVPSPS